MRLEITRGRLLGVAGPLERLDLSIPGGATAAGTNDGVGVRRHRLRALARRAICIAEADREIRIALIELGGTLPALERTFLVGMVGEAARDLILCRRRARESRRRLAQGAPSARVILGREAQLGELEREVQLAWVRGDEGSVAGRALGRVLAAVARRSGGSGSAGSTRAAAS